ncbi:MAG: hypothetical protein JNL72_00230 [Flavipsychrobacter sp.]|nr:hypothetical protein [Flavipsychrobacter sp.]
MPESQQSELVQLLQAEWGLQLTGQVSEEVILAELERRVLAIADKNPEAFFQLMYRLDVPEQKVKAVLFEPDAAMQIARLIYRRQLQKIEARKAFNNAAEDVEDDLKW